MEMGTLIDNINNSYKAIKKEFNKNNDLNNENLALLTLIEYSLNYYKYDDKDVLNVVNNVFNTNLNENNLDIIDEAIYLEQNEDFKINRINLTIENLTDQINEYNYKDVKFREF